MIKKWFFNMFIKDKTGRSGIINLALKPLGLVLSLAYTPLLLSYLGDEKYGLWATILSIVNWVNYFDVGIGNGLRNILTKEIAENKKQEAQKSISTAYVILSFISVVLLLVVLICIYILDWKHILSTNIDMRLPLTVSFSLIITNFVLSLINIVLYALQKSEFIAICNVIIQIMNLLGLIVLKKTTESSLLAMSLLFGLSSSIIHLAYSIVIYSRFTHLRPKLLLFSKTKVSSICNIGIKFFVIQLMGMFLFTVDNLLITHFFGAVNVTPFSISNKVFNTAYSVFSAFMVPYWSRSTVAFKNSEIVWLKDSIKKTFGVAGIFIIGYIFISLFFQPICSIWLRKELSFQTGLIPVMCIFYSLFSILCVECQFINGSGKINVQMISYIIIGVLNIPFSIILGVGFNMGVVGIRLATTFLVFIEVIVLAFNLLSIFRQQAK